MVPGFYKLMEGNLDIIYENDNFTDTEEMVQFEVDLTGINGLEVKTNLSIFPNPVKNILTINSPMLIYRVEMVNNLGNVVISRRENNKTYIVDVSKFASGIYFIKVFSHDQAITRKLVIE